MASLSEIRKAFPNLKPGTFKKTSVATSAYNCIAWADEDVSNNWWPNPNGRWPSGVPMNDSIDAFVAAFETIGYERVDQIVAHDTKDIIALYGHAGSVKHAARKKLNGKWTSKLGADVDIEHTLNGLEGGMYGAVLTFLQRQQVKSHKTRKPKS